MPLNYRSCFSSFNLKELKDRIANFINILPLFIQVI